MRIFRESNIRIRAGLILGLLVALAIPASVFAAESVIESITLSPVSKRYALKAGTEQKDSFTVINDGKEAYDLITYARPYSVTDESYEPNFTNEAANADAYKWVQFNKPSYHLESGESVEVDYTIRVPEDASPGGHYGVLFAETQPLTVVEGTSVQRKKRVGSILYITVDGTFKTGGQLLSTSIPFFQAEPPLTTTQRVKNTGNTDFVVKSTMKVSDAFGNEKFSTDKEYAVLPASTRATPVEWPGASWLGVYKVDITTKFLDETKQSSKYVLMMPIWVYLLVGIVVGARVIYALAQRKR